jgi:hypothetical protein
MQFNRPTIFSAACLAGVMCLTAPSAAAAGDEGAARGIYRGVSTAVKFDVSPPLRLIPPLPIRPEEHTALENRNSGLEGPLGPQDFDPLVQFEVGPGEIPTPIVSFDGPSNIANVSPPDPVGDVGPNHYVAMSNLYFAIYNKTGTLLFGPAANNTLWAGFGGDCETDNDGDPIVVYDQLSDRWILTQFTASGPTYFNCVAVSQTGDPTGSYYRYAFSTGANFPDYPKYGVWPDALYISTREFAGASFAGVGAYAVNRAQIIAGNPAPQVISFLATPASAGGAFNVGDGLLPSDLDGSPPPPAGTPNFFLGSMDNGGPYGAPQDALTLWKFTADFTTPANSTFVLTNTIPITAYDTQPAFCSGRSCVPQPSTTNRIDHLGYRQRPMHRAAYRNFGSHQSIVTNQSIEASPTMSGIRWWELRDPNGTPTIFQEGTYAPGTTDGIHRWMGSIAMDTVGNMALGYSASDGTSTFPSSWYTGRLAGDPLGTMPQGEASFINGTGSQTGSQRWGDYTSMNIDPVDDCTFWYVNEYLPVTSSVGWRLRIGSFKFPSCSLGPTFTLAVTPASQSICAPTNGVYTVNIGSVSGFNSPVTLGATGNPAGTTVGFSTNPVVPPGSSTLTIGNTGAAAAGPYTINVTGSAAGPINLNQNVTLNVFTANPGAPTLTAPANGATGQPITPTFTWSAVAQAATYTLEVATDAAFTNIVHTGSGIASTTYNGATLNSNTTYYWRVRANNACGNGANSAAFSFSTQALPGDCGIGTTPNVLFTDGFETGAPGWTHSGTGDTWALSTANPRTGTTSYFALDPATISDQRLVSPAVALPTGQNPLTLSFWHVPSLEPNGASACYDGGILEVSTDGGTTWTQVPNANLLVGPYRGVISSSFSNPLAGLNAWCGTTSYINTIADVSAYAGQTARFRLRLGSDNSVSNPGWHIDDVKVQSCQPVTSCPNVDKGDFNDDSKVDLLFDNLTNNRNMVWLMDGITVTARSWISPDASATQQIVGADDFNADGKSDLVFWDTTTGVLEFWLMNGATRIGAAVPISGAPTLALNWKLAATGDFNADGKPDLLWRNETSQKLVIWTMNGTTKTGNIIPTPDQAVDGNWIVVAALDYNNDGNRDLLWYNFTSGRIVLWFMDASVVRITGQFTNPPAAGDANWRVLAGGDYGIGAGGTACSNDIVWRNETSGKEVVWYMDFAGNRTFGTFTIPDAPTVDPDGNPTPATNWIVTGPR